MISRDASSRGLLLAGGRSRFEVSPARNLGGPFPEVFRPYGEPGGWLPLSADWPSMRSSRRSVGASGRSRWAPATWAIAASVTPPTRAGRPRASIHRSVLGGPSRAVLPTPAHSPAHPARPDPRSLGAASSSPHQLGYSSRSPHGLRSSGPRWLQRSRPTRSMTSLSSSWSSHSSGMPLLP